VPRHQLTAGTSTLLSVAELDYAFIAEYAKVEPGGKLTTVGASYTHLIVSAVPAQHLLAVAGRIRAAENELPDVTVSIVSPGGRFKISLELSMSDASGIRPYDGKIGILFAANTLVPLLEPGLYEVFIAVDGQEARRLAFDVEVGRSGTA
jgi:hypothetical protein